jgi:hypothetical protein
MISDPSLRTRPSISEDDMISISHRQCNTRAGSMLPPIHLLLGLHGRAPMAVSEHMGRFPAWAMPLDDVRHSDITSEHSADQPSARPDPPKQAGPAALDTTLDKKSSWRRATKRWGLADWERDDSDARERRREQNREAQRRFREKNRHRAGADDLFSSPPE